MPRENCAAGLRPRILGAYRSFPMTSSSSRDASRSKARWGRRLAFLNGQVFHEGDTVAPGLVLKQVKQKGVILAYKGYRFEIGP